MKRIVIALGHEALGTTLPEQQKATRKTAKAVAEFIQKDYQVIITHSNGPQVGMIHTAMAEFCRIYPEYTATPMSVCSAMSQGYIGYDLQNAIRSELLSRVNLQDRIHDSDAGYGGSLTMRRSTGP